MIYKKVEQTQGISLSDAVGSKPKRRKKQKKRVFVGTESVQPWFRAMFDFAKEMERQRSTFVIGRDDPRKLYSNLSSIMYTFYRGRDALNASKDNIDPETFRFLTYVTDRINGEYMAYQIKTAMPDGSWYATREQYEDDLQEFLVTVMKHIRYTLFVSKEDCDAFCDGQDWAKSAHYHAPADNKKGYIDVRYNHTKRAV